jgi:RHS repeat-associated protein
MKVKSWIISTTICVIVNAGAQAMGVSGFILPARYYDATNGRFISPDTVVQSPDDPQSLNRYAYVRNNPLNLIDPSGQSWLSHSIGVHWDVNRVIYHNLGINQAGIAAFAGPGGELNFYFTPDGTKVGGGVGAGLGGHVGVSTGDFDIFVGHGAAATIGYDPIAGPYASTWGGCTLCGGANGSAAYYFDSGAYQIGGGYGVGQFGANVGYSNMGGVTVGGGYGGLGANYGLQSHETRYTISMNDKALADAYQDGKQNRTYDGFSAGPIVDFIGTVTAGWKAADLHDTHYRTLGVSKAEADLNLMTDMEDQPGHIHRRDWPGQPSA